MLTTLQLKEWIYRKFSNIINAVGKTEWDMKTNFSIAGANSFEGTYAFTLNDEYHYLFTEKGEIKFDKVTTSLDEITYWILENEIFTLAMLFAKDNRNENEDFRRLLFSKELELHFILGEYYYNKQKNHIKEVLKGNPYIDNK